MILVAMGGKTLIHDFPDGLLAEVVNDAPQLNPAGTKQIAVVREIQVSRKTYFLRMVLDLVAPS